MLGFDSFFSNAAAAEEAFQNVLESLAQFAAAPAVAQRCVYAVVSTTREADLQEYKTAFVHADKDGDGAISRTDLGAALSWASALSMVDPDLLFRAADVDNSGYLDFRKFAAACVFSKMAPLDEWLAEQAFDSLDVDGDRRVSRYDVLPTFGYLPTGLPTDRPFSLEEWKRGILSSAERSKAFGAPSPKKSVQFDGPEQSQGECGIAAGILAGCLKNKRSHKRQGSQFESVEDFVTIIDVGTPAPDYYGAAPRYNAYGHGAQLSSPTYVPMSSRIV